MQRFPFKAGSSNFLSHILDIFILQATHSFYTNSPRCQDIFMRSQIPSGDNAGRTSK